jgi:hypothetical protein
MEFRTIKLQLTFYKIIIMSSLLYSPFTQALRLKKSNCYFAYVSILGCRCFAMNIGICWRAAGGAGLIIQEATSVSRRTHLRRSRPLERGAHRN